MLKNLVVTDSLVGIRKGTTAGISNLTVSGGSISDGLIGIDFDKTTTVGAAAVGTADQVIIDGTSFSHLAYKGIYVEALSNAHITNVTMNDVAQYGAPSTSGTAGSGGDGIDLNLKNGSYSNIEIDNFHLTDVGASDRNGLDASGQRNGGAIVVEARSQGSYATVPGVVTGTINIHDGTIDGHTSTGIQAGEPTQTNAGPAVSVTNVTIAGAQHDALHGEIGNETQSTFTFNGTAAVESISTSQSSSGPIVFHGGGGGDTFAGHNELDTATYGVTLTISDISYDAANSQWVVNAGAEGIDRLSGVEKITDNAGHAFLLAGNGYTTVQAAVDAASDNNTILVSTGTHTENVTITDKALTLVGANHGTDGAGSRAAESIILGRVSVTGSKAVSFDGLEFRADATTGTTGHGNAALQLHGSGTYLVHNSLFYSDFVGGNVEATGIQLDTTVSGAVTIDGNSFTGSHASLFSGASWQRGIWSDGTSSDLDITHNTFANVRSAINLDGYNDATHDVSNNVFASAGSGISVGIPTGTAFTGIHDNDFQTVNDDFNFQNLTTAVNIDLTATHNTSTGGVAPIGGVLQILGSTVGDHITGSAIADNIFGNGGNDIIKGGAGADAIDGGTGIDTAVYSAALGLADVTFAAGKWTVHAGAEGVEMLSNVEIVDGGGEGGARMLLVGGDGFGTIQAAVDAAADGDTILISAGTHAENVTVTNKGLAFVGANHDVGGAGVRADESIILGRVSVTGSKAVEFDGIEFRADATTGTTGHGNAALQLHGSGTYTVHNSLFYSDFVGGNVEATGIQLDTTVSGTVNIDSNSFTGSKISNFSGASWQRAIWSDGTSTDLNITGNSFANVRSAMNLDGYNDATHEVSGNIFVSAGTAISVGIPTGTAYTGIHNNDFQSVGDDFNFQNLTTAVNINLTATSNASSGGTPALGGGLVQILGSTVGDNITGSAGNDSILANGGNDTINRDAGNDTVDGGAGTDTYAMPDAWGSYAITRSGGTYTITKAGETDTISNVENFSFNGNVVDVTGNADAIVSSIAPTIQSIVEAGPDEDSNPSTISVLENAALGTAVAMVSVADANLAAGDVLTYSLIDGSGNPYTGPFSITGSGGSATIKVAGAIDFEANSSFAFQVKVTDSAGHAATQGVPVFVLNVNEAPTNINLSNATVDEATNGAIVGTVTALDPEGGAVTFGVNDSRFEIVNIAGSQVLKLKSTAQFDFESGPHTIAVGVTASDLQANQSTTNFNIQVNNVNEAPSALGTQSERITLGSIERPLNLNVAVDPEGAALSYTVNVVPADGTVLLDSHALALNQMLTTAEVQRLTYTAPATHTGTFGLQLSYTDGVNGAQSLAVDLNVVAAGAAGKDTFDFNADSKTDLFFINNTTHGAAVWELNGHTVIASPQIGVINDAGGWHYADKGDYNHDAKTDLLFLNDTTHGVAIWQMNGTTVTSSSQVGTVNAAAGWAYAETADFGGDGKSDMLFLNGTTNGIAIWQMNGTTVTGSPQVGTMTAGFHLAGLGDFDGDGKTDLLTVNDATNAIDVRLMNGVQATTETQVDTMASGFHFAGTGDFNGDGKTDVLTINDTTHAVDVRLMDGTQPTTESQIGTINAASGWHFAEVGDFNGDGQSDLLFVNDTTHGVAVWQINNGHVSAAPQVGTMDAGAHYQSLADTNADHKTDILFQNDTDHTVSVWQMDGTHMVSNSPVGTINAAADWHLIG
jgi:hypothetical protein